MLQAAERFSLSARAYQPRAGKWRAPSPTSRASDKVTRPHSAEALSYRLNLGAA